MAVNDVFQISLLGFGPTEELTVNTLFYAQTAGTSTLVSSNAISVADAICASLLPLWVPCIGTDWTFLEARIRGISAGVLGVDEISFTNTGAVGTASDQSGPLERCILFKKFTGVSGRHGQGRMFSPCPPVSSFAPDGRIDPTGPDFAAFAPMALQLILDVGMSTLFTWAPVLVNRATSAFLRLTGSAVRELVGIQRGRRFGIGS